MKCGYGLCCGGVCERCRLDRAEKERKSMTNPDAKVRGVEPRGPLSEMERGSLLLAEGDNQPCGWCSRTALALDDALLIARKERDEARRENICDACAGTGSPVSKLPCMCGGTGKMSRAAIYLREEMNKLRAQRDAAREGLEPYASKSNWYEKLPCGGRRFHDGSDNVVGHDHAAEALAKLEEKS